MSARSVWLVGNDGSGKTTLLRQLQARFEAQGAAAVPRHYYRSRVRRALRGLVERVAGVSRRKRDETPSGADLPAAPSAAPSRIRGSRALPFHAFLWVYQLAMAIEARMRDAFGRGPLLYDRSWLDDLVSTLETFRLETPGTLVRASVHLFPARRIYFLSAGHDAEYARIGEVDLSADVHRRKGLRYEELVGIVEGAGGPVLRIETGGPARPDGEAT